LILEDDFQSINKDVWNYEIQRGGFGSGTFEWTTNDPKNIYTDAEGLHIVPTLTTETTDITRDQLIDNHVLNLTVWLHSLVFAGYGTDINSVRLMGLAPQKASTTVLFDPTRPLVPLSILYAVAVFLQKVKRPSPLARLRSLQRCLKETGCGPPSG
jgi:hypothetical protein